VRGGARCRAASRADPRSHPDAGRDDTVGVLASEANVAETQQRWNATCVWDPDPGYLNATRRGLVNAIDLLIADHKKVTKLLTEGEETTERAEKTRTELRDTLKREMTVHEEIEERIFYPALKEHPKAREIVLEGYEEHHVVDEIMGELLQTDVADEQWAAKFKVMKENIEHHIEEEEGEMFKKARQAFSEDELEELGRRMEEMKRQAMATSA
jgi:hemerythrin superfamily protein